VLFVEIVLEGWGDHIWMCHLFKGWDIFVRTFEASIVIGRKEHD
jgi:hypothetical protein